MHMATCVKTVFQSTMHQALAIVLLVTCYGLIVRIPIFRKYPHLFHLLSFGAGFYMIYSFILDELARKHFFGFIATTYIVICGTLLLDLEDRDSVTPSYVIGSLLFLFMSEHLYQRITHNTEVRGLTMIVALKGTQMAMDLASYRLEILDPLEYLGYMFSPATVAFGPMVSFKEYMTIITNPRPLDWSWVRGLLRCILWMHLTFIVATCPKMPKQIDTFVDAYFVALSFRMSHYFISYFSEFTMIASGYSVRDGRNRNRWVYPISDPMEVEFPRSWNRVIYHWNIPMSKFLRAVYFDPMVHKGRFLATFGTFAFSAMYHGLNVEVTVVLLNIGVFCYIQYKFREILAQYFNACVKTRTCNACVAHRYKETYGTVMLANFLFGVWTMLDLAYFGIIMSDVGNVSNFTKSKNIILKKWGALGFFNHKVNYFLLPVCLFLHLIT